MREILLPITDTLMLAIGINADGIRGCLSLEI